MDYPNLLGAYPRLNGFQLIPIRREDRELIRQWRNEQMYHLRQKEPLTVEQQNTYFDTVVAPLFLAEQPTQYLFSYVKDGICFGYGGLVHINYHRKSAELSFIMNTRLEESEFSLHWSTYLALIEEIAFKRLELHKIFTYAYDLRPHLYPILEAGGFVHERTLENALIEQDKRIPALIHSKWNAKLRPATMNDMDQTFAWVNNPHIRKHSFQSGAVSWETHEAWFNKKLNDPHCLYFILENPQRDSMGSIRIDQSGNVGTISYLLDPSFHGQGWGSALLCLTLAPSKKAGINTLIGEVLPENSVSIAIFEKLRFSMEKAPDRLRFIKTIHV